MPKPLHLLFTLLGCCLFALTNAQQPNPSCIDSSYIKLFESPDRTYIFACSQKTADGGIVIAGYGNPKPNVPPYTIRPIITKFDSLGHHLWSKELTAGLSIRKISELKDGSLIVTCPSVNSLDVGAQKHTFIVAKLTATGNVIWFKTFKSLAGDPNCDDATIFDIVACDGENGEILLAGTEWSCPQPKLLVVFKLDRDGNLLWKWAFKGRWLDSYAMGIFYENNEVTVVNSEFQNYAGGDETIHYDFLKLNYATGTQISMKAWKVNLSYPASLYHSFTNYASATRLANGNYCLYGVNFGERNLNPANQPRFSVLEFNNNYDYVKGYTVYSSIVSNGSEARIEVNRFGQAVYVTTELLPVYPGNNRLIAVVENGFITNQRKRAYQAREGFNDNFEIFDDGSFALIGNLATAGQSNSYLQYNLLHASDTGSACLGEKTNFSYLLPADYVPHNFSWESVDPDPIAPVSNGGCSTVPLNYTELLNCSQTAICDTVKIHGNAASCSADATFTFTAYKNKSCGLAVQWSIDPSAVQTMQVVNDTTITLELKQQWQGWLYAMISSSCGQKRDSVLITLLSSPGAVNLGADTSICPGNSLKLNAHRGYASYKWNTGATDSTITVNTPGKYYVDVKDACGNLFSDTVNVFPAPPIPFSAGPDRVKCNSDTVHLTATAGFLNYSWGPSYNINSLTGQTVIVQPAVDTMYFVKAEKTPGCFAYDTVKIKVNHSLPLNLGADKSFCSGDSAVLNAGSLFSKYAWINGDTTQTITAKNTGHYSVVATALNGCKSYDTLQILNVWPNPQVNLNDDPKLCAGTSRILQAGNFASYSWQDGSTNSFYTVNNTGVYYVTVKDNNQCSGSDTVHINELIPAPANFLPADTAVCTYGTLTIQPTKTFSGYAWNNNATISSITISTPGIYWLQVKDKDNCTGRDSILVSSKQCLTGFYMPNAFTPDNNRVNDVFRPIMGGIVKQFELKIYNRWGQMVFATNNYLQGWDGKVNGITQDIGTYAWVCRFQFEGEKLRIEKGTMMLLR